MPVPWHPDQGSGGQVNRAVQMFTEVVRCRVKKLVPQFEQGTSGRDLVADLRYVGVGGVPARGAVAVQLLAGAGHHGQVGSRLRTRLDDPHVQCERLGVLHDLPAFLCGPQGTAGCCDPIDSMSGAPGHREGRRTRLPRALPGFDQADRAGEDTAAAGPAAVTGSQGTRRCPGVAVRGEQPPRERPQEERRNVVHTCLAPEPAGACGGVSMRHPIEVESYRILRCRADFAHLPPLTRAVVERIVHATADTGWPGEIVTAESALRAGWTALHSAASLVTDVRMVAAGITARQARVALDCPGAAELAAEAGLTRSAAGIRLAAQEHADGAVWVIGTAPTALDELVRLAAAGEVRPALVVGVPVGFVGAVSAKAALRRSGLPAVSTVTERGGAAVAAAVVNALLYAEIEGIR